MMPARIGRILPLPLLLLGLGACDSGTGPGELLQELPRPLTAAERAVLDSSNDFAFDLLRTLAEGSEENVIVSPLSVTMSVGMAMNGAAGNTWDEMRTGLRFGSLSQAEINASYRGLLDLLGELDPATEMSVANSVWYRQGFPFEQTFLETVQQSFSAEVAPLDFEDPASADVVNDWVSDQTRGRIPTIVDEIAPNDVMYLINAIYFKGDWRHRFDRSRTAEADFSTAGGRRVRVQMMHADGTFRYAWDPAFQVVDLPYGNGAFTMTLLLPAAGTTADAVIGQLDEARWAQIVGGLVEQKIAVELPRFRLEYEKKLNDALKALGIRQAFVPGGADFTRMSASMGHDLFVSEVLHKTFIEVDEEGTEAAAVTKTTMAVTSMPQTVRFDRPFVLAIRERLSGTILFLGKVGDPTAE